MDVPLNLSEFMGVSVHARACVTVGVLHIYTLMLMTIEGLIERA